MLELVSRPTSAAAALCFAPMITLIPSDSSSAVPSTGSSSKVGRTATRVSLSLNAVMSATQSPNASWNEFTSKRLESQNSGRKLSRIPCPVSWATTSVLAPERYVFPPPEAWKKLRLLRS